MRFFKLEKRASEVCSAALQKMSFSAFKFLIHSGSSKYLIMKATKFESFLQLCHHSRSDEH